MVKLSPDKEPDAETGSFLADEMKWEAPSRVTEHKGRYAGLFREQGSGSIRVQQVIGNLPRLP